MCVVRLEFVIEIRKRKEVPHPTPSFPHRDTQPLTAIQHPIRDYPVGVKQDEICNLKGGVKGARRGKKNEKDRNGHLDTSNERGNAPRRFTLGEHG